MRPGHLGAAQALDKGGLLAHRPDGLCQHQVGGVIPTEDRPRCSADSGDLQGRAASHAPSSRHWSSRRRSDDVRSARRCRRTTSAAEISALSHTGSTIIPALHTEIRPIAALACSSSATPAIQARTIRYRAGPSAPAEAEMNGTGSPHSSCHVDQVITDARPIVTWSRNPRQPRHSRRAHAPYRHHARQRL